MIEDALMAVGILERLKPNPGLSNPGLLVAGVTGPLLSADGFPARAVAAAPALLEAAA